jgi:hypothetical protein
LIRCKREQSAKTTFSIRRKFDLDSNEIDESELHNEKHDLHKVLMNDVTRIESIDPKYRNFK